MSCVWSHGAVRGSNAFPSELINSTSSAPNSSCGSVTYTVEPSADTSASKLYGREASIWVQLVLVGEVVRHNDRGFLRHAPERCHEQGLTTAQVPSASVARSSTCPWSPGTDSDVQVLPPSPVWRSSGPNAQPCVASLNRISPTPARFAAVARDRGVDPTASSSRWCRRRSSRSRPCRCGRRRVQSPSRKPWLVQPGRRL